MIKNWLSIKGTANYSLKTALRTIPRDSHGHSTLMTCLGLTTLFSSQSFSPTMVSLPGQPPPHFFFADIGCQLWAFHFLCGVSLWNTITFFYFLCPNFRHVWVFLLFKQAKSQSERMFLRVSLPWSGRCMLWNIKTHRVLLQERGEKNPTIQLPTPFKDCFSRPSLLTVFSG